MAKSKALSPELRRLASTLRELPEMAFREYSPQVEVIVRSESRDVRTIEHLLDGMLSFCYDGKMLVLFKKLCRYYSQYNTGTAQPKLNKFVCSRIPVLCPPLPEQRAIATALSDLDTELNALETRLSKTRLLKQAMMQELLTGRIRLV
jgi:hypothetical protein